MSGSQNEAVTDDHIGANESMGLRRIAECPANGLLIIGEMNRNGMKKEEQKFKFQLT